MPPSPPNAMPSPAPDTFISQLSIFLVLTESKSALVPVGCTTPSLSYCSSFSSSGAAAALHPCARNIPSNNDLENTINFRLCTSISLLLATNDNYQCLGKQSLAWSSFVWLWQKHGVLASFVISWQEQWTGKPCWLFVSYMVGTIEKQTNQGDFDQLQCLTPIGIPPSDESGIGSRFTGGKKKAWDTPYPPITRVEGV